MAMAAFGSCLYGTLSDIVSAKFVNLFEFRESKIVTQIEMQIPLVGCVDLDGVVPGFDPIDLRPEQEAVIRQGRYRHAAMVERKLLVRAEVSFAVIEVAVSRTEREVGETGPEISLPEHQTADAEEKDDLHDPEE